MTTFASPMTVAELMAALGGLDPNLPVACAYDSTAVCGAVGVEIEQIESPDGQHAARFAVIQELPYFDLMESLTSDQSPRAAS